LEGSSRDPSASCRIQGWDPACLHRVVVAKGEVNGSCVLIPDE